ncbi:MAG: hypothetical protein HUU08_16595 [Candidatus Brocadia sp.]|nr:hypothetical protein [Candidatus Brocadia sp.]
MNYLRVHSRFFVNLVNLVGWASPTKHLVHVVYFLVGDAHPTPGYRYLYILA